MQMWTLWFVKAFVFTAWIADRRSGMGSNDLCANANANATSNANCGAGQRHDHDATRHRRGSPGRWAGQHMEEEEEEEKQPRPWQNCGDTPYAEDSSSDI